MSALQLFSWSGLVNGIFSLGFGVFIASRDWKNRTNQLLFAFSLAVAFWAFSYSYWLTRIDFEGALFWTRMLDFGALWIPIFFFHWIDSVFGFSKEQKYVRYVLILGYALTITISFFAFSVLFVSTVEPELFFPFFPKAGILYHIYLFGLYIGLFILYSSFLLLRRYNKTSLDERARVSFLFSGIMLGAIGGATNFLLIYDIPVAPYGNFFVPVWVFFVGYTTVRYHAFGLKVFATEFLVFLIWSFLLSRIFLAAEIVGRVIDSILFIFVLGVGLLLIGSVRREARQREQLDKANHELQNLNEHLQEKVDEQTKEIKQAYDIEKKARIELEELDKAKDQFILTTQHHLRTPLTIIKGYLQSIIWQKYPAVDETTKNHALKAEEATDRISTLVNEFLDISQMQVGKSILNKEPTNIKTLIDNIVKELELEIQKKRLNVTLTMENNILMDIDPRKIREAITNIVDNAIKYNTIDGSITIQGVQTTNPIERDTQIFRLIIENTGIGITQEELSKLFTQYFQRGKEAEKLYTTGRGIGLTITKNIIQAHQGRIYAESGGRDKGAKFVVELPV